MKEKAVDQLILAARRVARLGAVVMTVGMLTSCQTLAGIGAGGQAVTPTAEEAAAIEDFRARAHRVGVAARLPQCRQGKLFSTSDCAPRVVLLDAFNKPLPRGQGTLSRDTVAIYRETAAGRHFHISRAVIQGAMAKHPAALAVLAHEIGHWIHQDPARLIATQITPQRAELEANASAPWVLVTGWGMSRQEAIQTVWGALIREAQRGRQASGAHLSACDELRDFERRLHLPAYTVERCA